MTRLILLVILGIVSTEYFPESREAVRTAVEPAVTPALEWHTENEINTVVQELKLYEQEHMGALPDATDFPDWLAVTLDPGTATDPWGGHYVLFQDQDTFTVVSFGRDRLPRTEDDLQVREVRERAERG